MCPRNEGARGRRPRSVADERGFPNWPAIRPTLTTGSVAPQVRTAAIWSRIFSFSRIVDRREVVERLRAVAGLEQKRATRGDLGQGLAQSARLAREHERRHPAELTGAASRARGPARRAGAAHRAGATTRGRTMRLSPSSQCRGAAAPLSLPSRCASSPASSPRARSTSATTAGGFRQYARDAGARRGVLLHRRPALDHRRVRAGRPARARRSTCSRCCSRPGSIPTRSTVFAQSHVHRARRGGLAALGRHELRPARPDDAVQGEGRQAGLRVGGPVHLPDPDGRGHPALPDRPRPDRRRPAAAPRALARRRGALQRALRRDVPRARGPVPGGPARGSWTCRSPRGRCRRRAARRRARC